MKKNYNKTVRIRYHFYRDLGYSSIEARKLSKRKLDLSIFKIKDERVVKNKVFREYKKSVKVPVSKTTKVNKELTNARESSYKIVRQFKKADENDTTLSSWGRMTSDKRFRDDTAKTVNKIQKSLNISNNQAYYFLYLMYNDNMSWSEVKRQMKVDPNFEVYKKLNYRYNKRR